MAERAQVTSVAAIEAFRARLIVYLSKARPTLEEISNEVRRTRVWLQVDQRRFWEKELRLRQKKLERAQSELFSARVSVMEEPKSGQQMAVRRALEDVREAESKLALLKKWDRELDNRSEPLVKPVEQLHNYLTIEMARAVAHLGQVIKALENYAGVAASGSSPQNPSRPDDRPVESRGSDEGESS
jgi:hypothetical protein